ncbi:MAG TPA: hypothetical protein VHJ20_15365, partial [Polyangia bacterium]|nr:hypothetical protein [Polyangia bacterium]
KQEDAILGAFSRSGPDARAALAPVLARFSSGRRALEATTRAAREPEVVQLAAATALAAPAVSSTAVTRARLVAPDGTPLVGRWIEAHAGGAVVRARTDADGRVRLAGLPAGAVTLTVLE